MKLLLNASLIAAGPHQVLSSFRRERTVESHLSTLAIPFLLLLSNHMTEGSRCLHLAWKINNIKVADDCNILTNQISVSVAKLTDKSECINKLFLDIAGELMGAWRNTNGSSVNEVALENIYLEQQT